MGLRYFLDTEFYEDGSTIDLISIGVACSDGREFYAASRNARLDRVSPWLRENVLPNLPPYSDKAWMDRSFIRGGLEVFFGIDDARPAAYQHEGLSEIWAYYGAYDWVCLCQLWNTMMEMPRYIRAPIFELKQLATSLGIKKEQFPVQQGQKHNALADARWNRDLYNFLIAEQAKRNRPADTSL